MMEEEQEFYLTGGGKSYLALSGDKWLEDCAETDDRKIFVIALIETHDLDASLFIDLDLLFNVLCWRLKRLTSPTAIASEQLVGLAVLTLIKGEKIAQLGFGEATGSRFTVKSTVARIRCLDT